MHYMNVTTNSLTPLKHDRMRHSVLMCISACVRLAGRLNVGNDELDEMLKEASGPINFTVFLTMFGEKLKGKNQIHQH